MAQTRRYSNPTPEDVVKKEKRVSEGECEGEEEGAAGLAHAGGAGASSVSGRVSVSAVHTWSCENMHGHEIGQHGDLLADESAPFPKVSPSGQYLHR